MRWIAIVSLAHLGLGCGPALPAGSAPAAGSARPTGAVAHGVDCYPSIQIPPPDDGFVRFVPLPPDCVGVDILPRFVVRIEQRDRGLAIHVFQPPPPCNPAYLAQPSFNPEQWRTLHKESLGSCEKPPPIAFVLVRIVDGTTHVSEATDTSGAAEFDALELRHFAPSGSASILIAGVPPINAAELEADVRVALSAIAMDSARIAAAAAPEPSDTSTSSARVPLTQSDSEADAVYEEAEKKHARRTAVAADRTVRFRCPRGEKPSVVRAGCMCGSAILNPCNFGGMYPVLQGNVCVFQCPPDNTNDWEPKTEEERCLKKCNEESGYRYIGQCQMSCEGSK